jgi:nucleoside 2-deoxyribosyltransferase
VIIKEQMRVYVAGAFTTLRGIQRVVKLQRALKSMGLEVLNQLKPFKWRKLYDFKKDRALAKRIVEHDLSLLEKADVIVALADKPSWGVGVEVFYAKILLRKKVVAIVTKPARSPWVINYADIVLEELNAEKIAESIKALGGR